MHARLPGLEATMEKLKQSTNKHWESWEARSMFKPPAHEQSSAEAVAPCGGRHPGALGPEISTAVHKTGQRKCPGVAS